MLRYCHYVLQLNNTNALFFLFLFFCASVSRFMVYTCLPDGKPDEASLKVQLYSRAKTMRQVCADVKSSLNLTARVDTRLSLKKMEAETVQGACTAEGWGGWGLVGRGTSDVM